MARKPRLVIPGLPHHITHRGNNKKNLFYDHADREMYLYFLKKYSQKFNLIILGYSLMTNHVHILGIPGNKNSLAKAIGITHMRYAQYLNLKYGWSDHVWSERFKSSPAEFSLCSVLLAYIELNAVRAGIAKTASEYKYSSALAHVTGIDISGILDMRWFMESNDCDSWKGILQNQIDCVEVNRIRDCTLRNIPMSNSNRPVIQSSNKSQEFYKNLYFEIKN
jgi:putative transposase